MICYLLTNLTGRRAQQWADAESERLAYATRVTMTQIGSRVVDDGTLFEYEAISR